MEKMAWACEHSARVGVLVKTPVETHGFYLSVEQAKALWVELGVAIEEAEHPKEDPDFVVWWEALPVADDSGGSLWRRLGDAAIHKDTAREAWKAARRK